MPISKLEASNGTSTPMASHTEHAPTVLKASYQSPTGLADFHHVIAAPVSHALNSEAKTQYLGELRASSRKLQDEINKFLTEKMDEDKKGQNQESTSGASLQKTQEELEEENYGEEVAGDDT
ncbi:hypothetical protein PV08_05218 [Exophiala spinifera]|uniref:EKC/KEOPS complex subunit GON7 n=1 Tax=Exophiala spinifera TaxID=91928 RepID=A0A0D2B8C4_9EURO|nr:uncharacterized protein PV08_05218 [Exophiala spinifera]KIW15173.1 hypothetical protein PV08_05218 [Exophiala spinifera]